MFGPVDWLKLFGFDTPILEIVLRGTLMYLGLFFLLRIVHKRQTGGISTADVLLVVLIADAAQNAMADDYKSVTDGFLLVSVIIFWSHVVNWLGYHVPAFERFVNPAPLPLIENGKLNRRNMREELVTYDELMMQLREQGVEDPKDVKIARMESDGRLSVITDEPGETQAREKVIG
ncbi:MAG: DUF421 domain-containing protein [Bryobacteraceae bacterium]|nr:DUF421 domain-containing protein [Bryobacteraceae bacterium]